MEYLTSDQAKKYILVNFSLFDLFGLFDLSNFQKVQLLHVCKFKVEVLPHLEI